MKRFHCVCGKEIFFEDVECPECKRLLGFNPDTLTLLMRLPQERSKQWRDMDGSTWRACTNRDYAVGCNWLVDADDTHAQCLSCRLTRTIPMQSVPVNVNRWRLLERAKRRLMYSLLWMKLPIVGRAEDPYNGLAFDFLEDQRSNPAVRRKVVYTGHTHGVITLNAMEADEVHRVAARISLNENYRTLLGHMRHETGHYYWTHLIQSQEKWLSRFRHLFGLEDNYRQALDCYYAYGAVDSWQDRHISAYASSHPWEDWAETWAHYLHMMDTLETAMEFGTLNTIDLHSMDFNLLAQEWQRLTVVMNALNHSMGQGDVYPFKLTRQVTVKLRFVHRVIESQHRSH